MKVGDLIRCIDFGDVGLIVEINDWRGATKYPLSAPYYTPYCILYEGKLEWHGKNYVENECEVVNESR